VIQPGGDKGTAYLRNSLTYVERSEIVKASGATSAKAHNWNGKTSRSAEALLPRTEVRGFHSTNAGPYAALNPAGLSRKHERTRICP
jgi:hypothetical protein